MIEFEPIRAQTPVTGDIFRLAVPGKEVTSWDCVSPCIVIGHQNGQPVLQAPGGPKVNDGALLSEGTLRTRGKAGQVPIEVLTLGFYKKIKPEELIGRVVARSHFDRDANIIICDDKTYVKLTFETRFDSYPYLATPDLTFEDLIALNLIDEDTEIIYEGQKKAKEEAQAVAVGEGRLEEAISALGLNRVKALVDSQVDATALV